MRKGRAEFFFNNLQPFLHALIMYVCAFVLAAGAMLTLRLWPRGSETLRRSAFYIAVLALIVHTAGLLLRMWLERRPPVTNLYSSAIFIGWAVAVLGVVLERVYRVGIGVAAAALIGFMTLIIAHNLALGGDTMEMMRAVLDSNFWLTSHVITITLGYAGMYVAGFLGIVYVLVGVSTPLLGLRLTAEGQAETVAAERDSLSGGASLATTNTIHKALGRMVYGTICFAALFSFVGTVLGGIWADQSWGRFWGWGPEGKRRVADCVVVRGDFARAPRRLDPGTGPDEHGHFWQHRDRLFLVRRQHARCGLAFVRIHGSRIQMDCDLRRQSGGDHCAGSAATELVAQFPAGQCGPSRRRITRWGSAHYFVFRKNVPWIMGRTGVSGTFPVLAGSPGRNRLGSDSGGRNLGGPARRRKNGSTAPIPSRWGA